jgi:hypothetical protein
MKRLMIPLALLSLLATSAIAEETERPEPEVHGVFDGDEMYTLLPLDAIPAIIEPEYVKGKEAASQMLPHEPVIGVASGDQAVCWSTWQLDHHEIVNDQLGGRAIAATW